MARLLVLGRSALLRRRRRGLRNGRALAQTLLEGRGERRLLRSGENGSAHHVHEETILRDRAAGTEAHPDEHRAALDVLEGDARAETAAPAARVVAVVAVVAHDPDLARR